MIVTNSRQILAGTVLPPLAAGAAALFLSCAAVAQNAPGPQLDVAPATEPQPPTAPSQAQPPQRSNPPGLFAVIGRWVDDSIGNMTSGWNSARDAVGGLGDQ